MKHPETIYSHDINNNCTIIKWGEAGYYKTDYPKGGYTDDVINELNAEAGFTPNERKAMEICSIAAQDNPDWNWDDHYNMILGILNSK